MKTKAEHEKEIFELDKQKRELFGRINKLEDRQKLAGLYLQCIRLLPDYINTHCLMQSPDFDRVLNILEQNEFPEGF